MKPFSQEFCFHVSMIYLNELPIIRKLLTGLLFITIVNSIYAQDWTLRKNEDSIQVYTAFTENSKFKRIRADFTIKTSREKLFEHLLQIDQYPQWQYKTLQSRVVQQKSKHELIYYNEVDAPWPVSNRDLVIHLKIHETPQSPEFRILTWSEPTLVPVKDGLVRVPSSNGEWLVHELPDGKLKVRFEMQIDPGGEVPSWLVNLTSALAPYETFKNLKDRLEGF